MCLTYLPVVHRKSGLVEETRRLLDRSLAEARGRGSIEYEGIARANLARVPVREGNLVQAQLNAQAALELWQPPVKMPFKSLALWPLIRVGLARDHVSPVIDYARALLEPDQQPLPVALKSIVERAVAALETGEADSARTNSVERLSRPGS
jgi:hypothetical protein